MGLPHALLKVDKPEAFDLGKGERSRSWMPVFNRMVDFFGGGNFLEPMQNLDRATLVTRLIQHDNGYSGEPEEVADRILEWMGDDVCILSNGWEEMVMHIEDENPDIESEFSDTAEIVTCPLLQYRQTGSVWGT